MFTAQKRVFDKILNGSSVDLLGVSYFEMHGTGTRAGDPISIESVVNTFSPAKRIGPRDAENPVFVGAVKSNVGDGEAAAGMTSLAKVLLTMKHKTTPPYTGLRTMLDQNFPQT